MGLLGGERGLFRRLSFPLTAPFPARANRSLKPCITTRPGGASSSAGASVENVTPAMRTYEISGKTVLDQWFSYRRRDRTKPLIGDRRPPSPLEKIQPDGLARRIYGGPA